MPYRFNHMELTFPPGGLDEATRRDIAAFYGEMFGWSGFDVELFDQKNFLLAGDDASQSFILLAGGRRTPAEVPVEVDGDEGLAAVVLGVMAVTP